MTWWVALSAGMAVLLSLFLLGVPIFVAFVVLNVIGVFVFFGVSGFGLFANSIYSTATLGALSAVPLFIVMGEILFRSGAMDVLFDSLDRLIGRIRAVNTCCASCSAILERCRRRHAAGLLGRSLFPTMRKRGYDTQCPAGTIRRREPRSDHPPSVLAVIIVTLPMSPPARC
jgi:TRAP-type mannitol/chloroaromatic compound transport system permease large subunit